MTNERSKKNFDDLTSGITAQDTRQRVAVVWATDASTREAVGKALAGGLADFIFVGGGEENFRELTANYEGHVSYHEADTPDEAARRAVQLVRGGEANVLMKGLVNSDILLKCVLDREHGLLPHGRVLSHVVVAQLPTYDKLLAYTDAAVIPYPTNEQRRIQIRYVADVCHTLGIDEPRISLIHCSEKADGRHFPYTADYADIVREAQHGDFGRCIVDGPLDVKTSCDPYSMHVKHIDSPIEGQADALVFPDIEAANTFHKAITLFCHAKIAGLLQGPDVPIVMTSRGEDIDSKYYSLVLALLKSLPQPLQKEGSQTASGPSHHKSSPTPFEESWDGIAPKNQ